MNPRSIQRSQNKDSLAVHLKLDEVIAAINGASNRLIDVEALSEADLEALRAHYRHLSGVVTDEGASPHPIEEDREPSDQQAASRVACEPCVIPRRRKCAGKDET